MLPTTVNIRTLLKERENRVGALVGENPELNVVLQFVSDLIEAFDGYRSTSPRPHHASTLRLRTNERICQLVQAITKADCVFIRLVQTDGSVLLYHVDSDTPLLVWSNPAQQIGRPPEEKGRNEGISGQILNAATTTPIVIKDVLSDSSFREAHQHSLQRHGVDTPEGRFVQAIRSEACVPLEVQGKILAGIVAVRWQVYTDNDVNDIATSLARWQGVLGSLYCTGLQLERREQLQQRLSDLSITLPLLGNSLTNDEYLRKVVTVLTCEAGLRWHRAMVFIFDDCYPSNARCVMAIGGTGDPSWTIQQREVKGWSLSRYLLQTEFHDFASPDPLFTLVGASSSIVIPVEAFQQNKLLHAFLLGEADADLIGSDLFSIPSGSSWLGGLSKLGEVFKPTTNDSAHYIAVLHQPSTGLPIGFVLLDNPYPHPYEQEHNLPLTRMVCDQVAAHLAERGVGVKKWADTTDTSNRTCFGERTAIPGYTV